MLTKIGFIKAGKVSVVLLVVSALVAIVGQLFVAAPAKADCEYQGQTYKTGEKVGSFICGSDSNWQRND